MMEAQVNKQKIKNYQKLIKEISALEERIGHLENSGSEFVTDVVQNYKSGYPKALAIRGYGSERLPRLQERMVKRTAERLEIEAYVDSIEDGVMWSILNCHFIEGRTIEETAEKVGYSERHIRRNIDSFFEKDVR